MVLMDVAVVVLVYQQQVLCRVSAHPYGDRVWGPDREPDEGLPHAVPDACPVAGQTGYCLDVDRHEDPDGVRWCLLWIGKDYCQGVEPLVSDRVLAPMGWHLVLAQVSRPEWRPSV